jgi:hypothetical protein
VELTAERLPDLAKEAFLFSQQTSMRERDRFALHLVKQFASGICMDVAGKALSDVGVLVRQIVTLNLLDLCSLHSVDEKWIPSRPPSPSATRCCGEEAQISRIFILWGWTFLGSKISNALVQVSSADLSLDVSLY